MARVDELLDQIGELPALPSSAARIVSLLSSPDPNLDDVHAIVRCDEAISIAVLRLANSAQYGRTGRVFSLAESINRLGSRTLLRLAMQQQVGSVMKDAGSAYGLRRGALWRGALGGALAASAIAQDHGNEEGDLCFLCGLLRDVGKLALDTFVDDGFAEAAPEGDTSFLDIERELFGANHAEIGAALAKRWGLPDRIAFVIEHHHAPPPPEDPAHDAVADIVHAADVLCLWAGLATGFDGLRYPLAEHVRTGILEDRAHAELLMADMMIELRDIEEQLSPAAQEKTA